MYLALKAAVSISADHHHHHNCRVYAWVHEGNYWILHLPLRVHNLPLYMMDRIIVRDTWKGKKEKNFMRRYVGDRMYGGANSQQLRKFASHWSYHIPYPPSPVSVHSDSLVYSVTGCWKRFDSFFLLVLCHPVRAQLEPAFLTRTPQFSPHLSRKALWLFTIMWRWWVDINLSHANQGQGARTRTRRRGLRRQWPFSSLG